MMQARKTGGLPAWMPRMRRYARGAGALLALAAPPSWAQSHAPLTAGSPERVATVTAPGSVAVPLLGAVPGTDVPGAAAPRQDPVASLSPPRRRAEPVGDATRRLLEVQAGGGQSAPARPALGATASLSWQRYLDSFKHPQPLWFDRRVQRDDGGGP